MYPRTVKIRSSNGTLNEYVRIVEAYREAGKVKQRVVAVFQVKHDTAHAADDLVHQYKYVGVAPEV